MLIFRVLTSAVLLSVLAAPTSAKTTIVVDFGAHPSALAAGHAEEDVNWLDADLRDDGVCTQCFAALELQHYLRRVTGRGDDFEICDDEAAPAGDWILIGGPDSNAVSRRLAPKLGVDARQLADLGPQGYRIKTAAIGGRRATLIAGASRAATLYAVYDVLHRLGVRWFGPESFQEETPAAAWNPTWDVAEKPDYVMRGFMAWQPRGDEKFLLWMARNRLNDWTIACPHHALMRKLGIKLVAGNHDTLGLLFHPNAAYPYDHASFRGDESKPKDPYPRSEQFEGDANGDGKLSYAEAHPEWQALLGGRRVGNIRDAFGNNFCTSNPDACREYMKRFVDAVATGPYRGADIVRFWMLDWGKWCECDKCKSLGQPTDRNLLLVNQLDKALKRAHEAGRLNRRVPIRFLVYADVLAPPSRPLPEDFDYATCTATFYPIRRCYLHQIDDPTCKENRYFMGIYHRWFTAADRLYRGNVVVGEYYNVSRFRCLPLCFMHIMAHDIPYFHKVGAREFKYMHVTTGRWGNKSLTNYQMARQLWDVRTDCESLWKDYFARRYGPVAGTMRDFYESLEQMFASIDRLKTNRRTTLSFLLDRGALDLFPDPHLRYDRRPGVETVGPTLVEMVQSGNRCRKWIDTALAADVPRRIRQRLVEDERLFTYGERTLNYYYECATAFQLARSGRKAEARPHLAEAKRLASLLEKDTWSMRFSYLQDGRSDRNGLVCTQAAGAIKHLETLVGADDEEAKRGDKEVEP